MRQFAGEWCGPATLTIGGTLQSALPRNELRITASMVDDTIMSLYPGEYTAYPERYPDTLGYGDIIVSSTLEAVRSSFLGNAD